MNFMRVFYCDTDIFSGHEKMFLAAACGVSDKFPCVLILNEHNPKALAYCREHGHFDQIITVPIKTVKFASLVTWFMWGDILKIKKILQKYHATSVVVSQGRIEIGNLGSMAARLISVPVTSYIPMAHGYVELYGKSATHLFKDALCAILYRLPARYITISDSVKASLQQKSGRDTPVDVVANYIDRKPQADVADAATPLSDVPPGTFTLVIPGRLLDKQKGQIDYLTALKTVIAQQPNVKCFLVGEGEDKARIRAFITANQLHNHVELLGNRDDMLAIMSQADMIVIPSKFEGVPLVLIEAALLNKKIIASRIDGIKDYLNATYLFDSHNIDEMSRVTLQHMTSSGEDNYRTSLKALIQRHQDDFINDFYAALIQPSVENAS